MNCALNIDQQRALFRKVYGDLTDLKSNNKPLLVKDYIQSVYNLVYTKSGDHAMALDYTRLVPHLIMRSMIKDEDLMDHLLSNGFDLAALNSIKKKFTQQIENVENYISSNNKALEDLKELQKQVIDNGDKLEPNPLRAVGSRVLPIQEFRAAPPTALADRGQEAISWKEGDPNFNVPNPGVAFYYKAKRRIVELLSDPSVDFNSENLVYPGFGKIKLTIMSSSRIPEDQLYPNTPVNTEAHKKGVSMVVTDQYGTPIRLDSDLNVNFQSGKMVYYHIRRTDNIVDGDNVTMTTEDMNSVDALVRSTNVTREEATDVIKQQIKFIDDLRKYINQDPTTNQIIANINGGSLGYAYNDYVKINNSLSSVNFEGESFDPFQAREDNKQRGLMKGFTYFYTKGMLDTPVEVKLSEMNSEMKDKLISIFTDDLYEKDPSGNSFLVSPSDRQAIIDNYIKTGPDTIQLIPNSDNKTYAIIIEGNKVDTSDIVLLKEAVTNYFNEVKESKFVNAKRIPKDATVIKETDPNYKSKLKSGYYLEKIVDGKVKHYLVEGKKLHINNKSLNKDFDDVSFDKAQPGAIFLNRNITPYNEFIKNNFHIDYELNGEKKLLKLNAYLTFVPLDTELEKVYPRNEEITKAETIPPIETISQTSGPADIGSIDDLLRETFEDPELNKLLDQKDKGLKATQQQIEEAKEWYSKHPLNKHFPFKTMFGIINTSNIDSIATWTKSGITLYQGADYSDLYHEAWHGFSQAFLTKDQRSSLYNEAKKLNGTFTDYNGNTVRFSNANDLQIEEYLAEDFRSYVLKGKTNISSPVRNSIFRKILDFLKALFGKSTTVEVTDNERAIQTINDLYEKLRVGNLKEFSFNAENRNFDKLNKGVLATNPEEIQKSLNYQNSKLMVDTIDSLISEYIDRANAGLTDIEKLRAAELSRKEQIRSITPEEKSELKGLQSRQSYKYTSTILKTEAGIKKAYKYAQIRLATIRNEMVNSLPTMNTINAERAQNTIDLIDYTLRNYGNIDLLKSNIDGKGMIAYHQLKSKYISQEDRELFFDGELENEDDKYLKGKEGYDRGGNESSLEAMASTEVLYLMRSLHKVDSTGKPVLNKLGVPELVEFEQVWNRLARMLQNTLSAEEMYRKLEVESVTYPPARQLLNKLGPVRTQSSSEFAMWTSFWQTFNKTRIPLIQMTVDKTTVDDSGNKIQPTYAIRIGEASADYKKVGLRWENYFKTSYDNPYIKTDSYGANFLDVAKVLKDFPQNSLEGREHEFFNAIGMRLSDKNEIYDALRKKNVGNARAIRNALFLINQRGNITVDSVGAIVKEYPAITVGSESFQKIPGEKRNYNQLQELEARYSDEFSNFMVTNAEGNAQFEHSLNNSLTVITNTVNQVASYDELMQYPYMSYLDIRRNPFAKASIWLNSIFDMNKPGRPKRRQSDDPKSPFVNINLQNLSGVATLVDGTSTDEGVASAKADEFTKMILDFHLTIVNGTPELMRHADKGTSFSVWLSNINTKSESKRLYVDTSSFITVNNRIPGYSEAFSLVLPYIGAELERIKEMNRLSEQGINNFDFNYLERGKDFVIFDDVLSKETKDKLLSLEYPLQEYLRGAVREDLNLVSDIFKDFTKYFETKVLEADVQISRAKFVADSVISQIKTEASKRKIQGVNEVIAYKAAINSFVFNTWIHNLESIGFIYGDLAQYNMLKEEFHKRNAGMASTGDIFRTDQNAKDYVNNVLGRQYAQSINAEIKAFDGSFDSAIMGDNEIGSKYYEDYLKALGDPEAAKAYAEGKMTEGDAQGWTSFDSYRILKTLEGKWTKKHEELYQKEISGIAIRPEEVTNFFNTLKVQYFGPLDSNGLPITAFHKFSLFPLIPSVIKGTNLENLHNKMVTNGVDYALFKSGSKVGTITKSGKTDKFYSNQETRELSKDTFTKNKVFLEFLKDQLEIAPEYKGKVIFSTQLRKLIEDGLMEGGVPTDYKPSKDVTGRIREWSRLTDKQKLDISPRYRLLKQYENNINTLTEVKKKELLKEAGWKMENGTPTGSIEKLLEFVSKELSRQDLADHELEFIQVGKDGQLKHDLSMSLSADKIERLLNALVTRRLVKQKVNGEGLIQVSGAGFENMDAYTNPSEKDLSKWGTNDLPTYHKGKDGKTTAMKVKIALQGHFEKLLELPSVKDYARTNRVTEIQALNSLVKDEQWLDTDNNRRMITMVGVRIPVQGLNSMEFMEVYEFLPKQAGNIIVPPAEIVAKSGSDFDIDKLTVMMPTFRYIDGKMEVAKQYNKEQISELYEKTKKAKLEKGLLRNSEGSIVENDTNKFVKDEQGNWVKQSLDLTRYNDLSNKIFGIDINNLDEELIDEILSEEKMPTLTEFSDKLNGSKAIENDLIWNIREILELPENFSNLIRPNGTDIVEPLARELQDQVMEYNPKKRVFDNPDKNKQVSGTRVLELSYNLYKHSSNNIGKQTLGLGAVDNTYNVVFNRIGARMNTSYMQGKGKNKYEKRLTLLLPHNNIEVDGKQAISLSHIHDANNQNKISDVISQLMNGWVDIAKDAWIFNIQGNKEIAPSLLFMIQAGVPFKEAVYLVSQPLVREYVKQQKLAKSTFAEQLGKAASNPMFFRTKAREAILLNPRYGFDELVGSINERGFDQKLYNYTVELTSRNKEAFQEDNLKKVIKQYSDNTKANELHETTEAERATFLHFLEIEGMSKAVRDVKMRMNFDTSKSATLFDAQNRQLMVDELRSDGRIPESIVSNILEDSPIGSFYIQPFQLEIWKDLFKLRNHPVLNAFLMEKFASNNVEDINRTYGNAEKFANEFRNDLMSFIFQNTVRDFDINSDTYKGLTLDKSLPVKTVASLQFGAVVRTDIENPTMYVDRSQLEKDFINRWFSTEVYAKKGLATIPANAFPYSRDYYKFVFEREYLRVMYPIEKLVQSEDFQDKYEHNLSNKNNMREDESEQSFVKRMKGVTYEEMLRDMALDNTFNAWKIFKSTNTYADQFLRIRDKYPELSANYNIVKSLTFTSNKGGLKNLRLNDTLLDADKIDIFNENLLALSNSTIKKVEDPIENERISQFFSRFTTYAFLQSGLNTSSTFSLVRLVPQQSFIATMEEPVKNYIEDLNNTTLEKYYQKFISANDINNAKNRTRYKEYSVDRIDLKKDKKTKLISQETEDITVSNPEVSLFSTDYVGNLLYDAEDIKPSEVRKLVSSNPDIVFVYNGATESQVNASKFDFSLHNVSSESGNVFALPTRKSYSGMNYYFSDIETEAGVRTIDPKNKQVIDNMIASLLELKNSGVTIAFNKAGYGQYMLGASDANGLNVDLSKAKAPKTFLYLSEQLFRNFGFKNPNYADTGTGRKVIQSTQEVSDDMVRDMLNHCFNT